MVFSGKKHGTGTPSHSCIRACEHTLPSCTENKGNAHRYGFSQVAGGQLTVGKLTAFQGYIFNLGFAIAQFGGNIVALLSAQGGVARIFQILEREPNPPQKPLPPPTSATGRAVQWSDMLREESEAIGSGVVSAPVGSKPAMQGLQGHVTFERVDFAYPSRPDVRVLKGFCLHVPAQTTAAIVGSSGGGKSSALALLSRLYQVI